MSLINLNDLFFTVQGEGAHAGRYALFVRMPFCNLACPWCDTSFNSWFTTTTHMVKERLAERPLCKFAVITGGEPMMNKHTPVMIEILKSHGYEIACETNGCYPILPGVDYATVSPKRFAPTPWHIHALAEPRAAEFKYVVDADFDFAVLDRHDTTDGRRYSLSPEFGDMHANVARILDYMASHPNWRLSLQTHKWIGIP